MDRGKHPDSDVRFDNAPYFKFNDGKVKFDTNWFDNANDNYGSASGFVPKSLLNRQKSVYQTLFCYRPVLLERIQPPSIRPISSMIA